jgi:hypothetical protein
MVRRSSSIATAMSLRNSSGGRGAIDRGAGARVRPEAMRGL